MYKILDKIMINFIDYDEGKPIVFLHDWNQNLETMDYLGQGLENYRKILLDFPGFGDSEEPYMPYSLDNYVSILRRLLLELNVENPIIVGNSFGAKVAIKYASKYDVEKLVLLLNPYWDNRGDLKDKELTLPIYPPFNSYSRRMAEKPARKDIGHIMRVTQTKVNEESVLEDAKMVSAPTLLIWEDDDKKEVLETVKELESSLQNVSMSMFAKSKDYYLENTNIVLDILNRFFEGNKVKKRSK